MTFDTLIDGIGPAGKTLHINYMSRKYLRVYGKGICEQIITRDDHITTETVSRQSRLEF